MASFDVSFVGASDSGVDTVEDTLVGNPLVVVFSFGGDVSVTSLSGRWTVLFVFEPEFIMKIQYWEFSIGYE